MTIQPGPELDLYLTKVVLKCSWCDAGHYAQAADGIQTGWYLPDHSFLAYKFEPSRSFPDAWRLASILVDRGFSFTLRGEVTTSWRAEFRRDEQNHHASSYLISPELAIASAALGIAP